MWKHFTINCEISGLAKFRDVGFKRFLAGSELEPFAKPKCRRH